MATLKDLRKRLTTTKDTKKIATAMTLVSSAKFRQYSLGFKNSQMYSKNILSIFWQFITYAKYNANYLPLLSKKENKNLYILITGDKGLCGGFNSQLFTTIREVTKKDKKDFSFICVGIKGASFIEEIFPGKMLMATPSTLREKDPTLEQIFSITKDWSINNIYLVYNKFVSSIKQIPCCELLFEEYTRKEDLPLFDAEPLTPAYTHKLLEDVTKSRLYNKILETKVGEEGARMFSMDSAARNATKMIDKLTLKCNRTRQAIITTELTEIISGAEALE